MIKKLFLVMLLSVMIFTPVFADSLIKIVPGAEVDIMFNKGVRLTNTSTIGKLSSQSYLGTCEVSVGDFLRITPKIGVAASNFETDQYNAIIGDITATNEVGLTYGIAGELDVYTFQNPTNVEYVNVLNGLKLTAIGEYRYLRTQLDSIDFGGIKIDNPIRNDVNIHKWEIGGKISQQFDFLNVTPYFGVVYSDLVGNYDFNLSILNLNEDIEARRNVGIRLGVSIEPIENVVISIDSRLIDETAIVISGKYRF